MLTATTPNEARIHAEHDRVLRLLRDAGDRPLSLAAMRDTGVRRPATVIYELRLRGHLIRRAGPGPGGAGFRLEGVADAARLAGETDVEADVEAAARRAPDRRPAKLRVAAVR